MRQGLTCVKLVGAAVVVVCAGFEVARAAEPPPDLLAARLLRRACGHVERGHLELAYGRLEEALSHGLAKPMQIVEDPCLAALFDVPPWRSRVHALLRRHAWDEEAATAPRDAAGERLVLVIRFRDPDDRPVARVRVDLGQGEGARCCADSTFALNPRRFACLRAGDSGRVAVETVWSPLSGGREASRRHVHFTAEREGFATCRGTIDFGVTPLPGAQEPLRSAWTAAQAGSQRGRPAWQALVILERVP